MRTSATVPLVADSWLSGYPSPGLGGCLPAVLLQRPLRCEACWLSGYPFPRAWRVPTRGAAATTSLWRSLLAFGVSIPRAWRVPTRGAAATSSSWRSLLAFGVSIPRAWREPTRGAAATTSSWRSLLAFGVSIPRAWRVPTRGAAATTSLRRSLLAFGVSIPRAWRVPTRGAAATSSSWRSLSAFGVSIPRAGGCLSACRCSDLLVAATTSSLRSLLPVIGHFESCLPPVDTRLRATHSAAAAPADGGRRFVLLLQHVFFVFFILRFDP